MKETATEWLFKQLWEEPKDKFTWYAILDKAKAIESEQHTAIYREGMANSEGMMNFLYTEVEGRVDALHNGRYKE